uniref:RNA-binding protein 12 n=1 Tax=Melanaphis sacchari TaxID=742174 RepID=A0A2H8TIS7_9HEMI
MSVIIRLQNLPWAANAADIRQYFQGLSIPEGGVHIVGGEKGDVFISFSTDEDARQAMLSDGGCIKDVQIRLLLSSRNEMQKVIDTARQQTMYNAYMQQNLMQQPQIPIVGSLPPLTAKVLPQPQQQVRPDRLDAQMIRRQPLINNMSVLMPQDKQQQMQQQLLSPKSLENRDREDKSQKRSDRSRSKSRERRSKSSRSGGSRRERSRSRDRRRRDRSRGRDRSRDRYRSGEGRSSSSRGSGGKSQRSRSPVANKGADAKLVGNQQAQINPWTCQYDNMQQQQAAMATVENHQPATMMNNVIPGGHGGFTQFRSPPQPPIIPGVLTPNSFHQPQQQQQPPPLMDRWPSNRGNRSRQQQQPYVPDNDFRPNAFGGGGSDDEDDRQTEFDNNFQGRFNENAPPGMRRGPPGQDFREQRGFGSNRGGPRFHKPQQAVPPVMGQHGRGGGIGQRPFNEFGNGSGPRFNHQQQQQPPRYGGHNNQEGGGRGRPSRFSSINENGKPSRFNQAPQQQPRRDNDDGRSADFDESCKKITPRYNDRYRYDVRNAQMPHYEGLCVEVNNMSNPFSYGDIRKVFDGIHIDGSAIKIQKHRQGVAFVRFDNNQNKNLAMKVNGTMYKGNHMVVKHLDDEAYERDNTDDRPYPTAAVAANVVDHVDLVDDDDDDEVATGQPSVSSDKKKPNKSKADDERSDDDDDDDDDDEDNDLVVCEKSANKDAASAEDGDGEQRKDPPTKYLKLKQLPITVTEEDVMNEFDGGNDVRRVTFYPDGEFMGAAVEFASTEAAESALKRYDCVLLGSTPVPVLRCTYKEYTQIKRKSGGGSRRFSSDNSGSGGGRHRHHGHHHGGGGGNNQHQQPSSAAGPPPPPNMSGAAPVVRSNCLYVYGLPTTVTNTDITQFFSDTSALPDKIHIMLSKFGRPTGESYCEFGSAQQASIAIAKNRTYMGPNLVYVEPINRSLMIQAITKPMQQHCNSHHQDMSWGGGGGPPSRQPHHHNQRPQQYGGHNNGGPYGGGGRPQQFNMNNGGGRGGGGGYTPRMRGPGPGPNAGPEGFGQPGCVIALDNVPYRADVQQIVDFFEGFELNSQNVIRRFNDFGKPTGEARVNLRNPQEAGRAVRLLQNKPIFNRPVQLTLL